MSYAVLLCFVLWYSTVSCGVLRSNPLESLRKFQIYLIDDKSRCNEINCTVLRCSVFSFDIMFWRFLPPIKHI
nr:MAG TPA: hypothetical protein [Caudoviricetes sp.]